MIPYGRQDISVEDIEAVTEVLRSDWLTRDRPAPLEQAMAAYCGSERDRGINATPPCTSLASHSISAR
jgi:dTDP-4-amino-4,6-dideoxygalactose transaminase